MAKLRNVVYLTQAQKDILFQHSQYPAPPSAPVITYSDNDIYIVQQSWNVDGSASDYLYIKDSGGVERLRVANNGMVRAAGFEGSGALLTNISASSITSGTIDVARLPSIALTDRFVYPTPTDFLVDYSANHDLLQKGDVVIFTTNKETYIHNGGTAWSMTDLTKLETPTDLVASVNGKAGVVVIGPADITWTPSHRTVTDTEKSSWNNKEDAISAGTSLQYWRGDKTWQPMPTSLPASDVYAWAKEANKPTYTHSEVGAAPASHTHLGSEITDASPVYYISGGGTTGAWTGTITGLAAYKEGLQIAYRIGVAGSSTTTLNINNLGAVTCYRYGSSKLTTHYGVGNVIPLVYMWNPSLPTPAYCWMLVSDTYDDVTDYNVRWQNSVVAGAFINGYQILMEGLDGKFYPLTPEGTTATSKVPVTTEFKVGGHILYYSSTTDVAQNALFGAYSLFESVYNSELHYTINNANGWATAGLPIYLKGTINSAGSFVLDGAGTAGATSWITQTLPSSDDGFVYIELGIMNNTYSVWRLVLEHPIYQFKNGKLRLYVTDDVIRENDARLTNARPASDVYTWAKQSVKPTYNFSEIGNTPTTLSGYGITDTLTTTAINSAISTAISNLVASSPATLDTLNELAAALGDDPAFATTMTNLIGTKVTANTAITGATKTKITYDSKGLVTGGADLVASDIPPLAYRANTWVPSWSDVTGKPTTFAPIIGPGAADAAAGNHTHDGRYYTETEIQSNNISMRRLTLNPNGVPTNNLGEPSVVEMALFQEQFNNKTEFYTIENLKFYTSPDGVTWTELTTISDTDKKNFLGGDWGTSGVVIPNNTAYFRIELTNNGNYVYLNAAYFYWQSSGHASKVKIRVQRGDGVWLQHTNSETSVSAWPGHLFLPFPIIAFHPSTTSTGLYRTIHIDFINTWDLNSTTNPSGWNLPIYLQKMQIWGGYPAGKRTVYSVNGDKEVTFPAKVTAPTFVGALTGTASGNLPNTHAASGVTTERITNWTAGYNHSQVAHAPSNAQENIIETIKVNGVALTPVSKAVDISTLVIGTGATNAAAGNHTHAFPTVIYVNYIGSENQNALEIYGGGSLDITVDSAVTVGGNQVFDSDGLLSNSSIQPTGLEWQPVYGVYSTGGTSIDVLSGKAALPAYGYEYKVVMVATTPAEDASEPTIQLNGVTGASYSYMWSRTQSTASDTATETHTSDTTGATYIGTGGNLHIYAGAGTGARTVVRLEFTITPIALGSGGYYSFTVQGTASAMFTGTAATAGSTLSNFVGTLYGYNTSSSISSILINHGIDAGAPDDASVYVYRRYKGF